MSVGRRSLWEILVPAYTPAGEFIPIEKHQEWDKECRKVSDGMTIARSALGEWKDGDTIVRERMIPVRFLALRSEAYDIVKLTKLFYNQKTVMAYKLSDEIIMYSGE